MLRQSSHSSSTLARSRCSLATRAGARAGLAPLLAVRAGVVALSVRSGSSLDQASVGVALAAGRGLDRRAVEQLRVGRHS